MLQPNPPSSMKPDALNIALLIRSDTQWHRDVLQGIAQYAKEQGGWNFTLPKTESRGEVWLPENWQGDGVISRITSEKLEADILSRRLKCVNVSGLQTVTAKIPRVICSEQETAIVAAEYLLKKRFHHFGFVGFPPWENYSNVFEFALTEQLSRQGYKLHCYRLGDTRPIGIKKNEFVQWLVKLPKPIAIVVWSSVMGQTIAQVCSDCKISLPESISILTIDNDAVWSALAQVPLSYVDQTPCRIGYVAAKLLKESIIDRQPLVSTYLKPAGVVERVSTAASPSNDPTLNQALKLIHTNMHELSNGGQMISVIQIARHLKVSKRILEIKFKSEFDCSPSEYLKQLQLNLVAQLLKTTSLNLTEIASKSGFAYPEVLVRAFKRKFNVTPIQFRQHWSDDCSVENQMN